MESSGDADREDLPLAGRACGAVLPVFLRAFTDLLDGFATARSGPPGGTLCPENTVGRAFGVRFPYGNPDTTASWLSL
jgi:hypothetical protein